MNIKNNLFSSVSILIIVSLALIVSGCSDSDAASDTEKPSDNSEQTFTLSLATALDESDTLMTSAFIFQELVEEKSDGKVEINYVGGPESIPGFNQGEAIQNGSIDISWNYGSYYADLIPEALVANFTELSYEEELERGSFDYLNTLHEDMNAIILGRTYPGNYRIFTTKKVESSDDLKGMKLRGTGAYTPVYEAFGIEGISLEGGELYSAVERGMVDGTGWSDFDVTGTSIQEIINYEVAPSFSTADGLILMNLDKWNELPGDIQQIILDSAKESYYKQGDVIEELRENQQEIFKEEGVETIELSDGDEFVENALEASWEWLSERVDDPEKLEEYFRK